MRFIFSVPSFARRDAPKRIETTVIFSVLNYSNVRTGAKVLAKFNPLCNRVLFGRNGHWQGKTERAFSGRHAIYLAQSQQESK
jgi:hypothetical protein